MNATKRLAEELRNGSYTAFQRLYDLYSGMLYGFALDLTKSPSEAEDILQETFMKVWLSRETISSDLSFKAYLFRIARNLMIDAFRKRMSYQVFADYMKSEEYRKSLADDIEGRLTFDEFLRDIESAKEELTARQKEIFELSREKGMPLADIAHHLGLSEQTVKNQLSGALKILREKLHRYTFFLPFL